MSQSHPITPPDELVRVDELNYHADEHSVDELISRVRAALATPPPEPPPELLRPIPVSERLPKAEDCAPWPGEPEATPWCWAGKHFEGVWEWAQISMLGLSANSLRWFIAGGGWSHWLPYNAIPFPEVAQ